MQGLRSVIVNCRIGGKIAAGFAAVLLILAVSSTLAWIAFGRVAGAVDGYAELVATSAIYRDIDLTVAQYRGHVREYAASDNDETAAMAVKEGTALHELIAKGLARVSNPERHGLLESMAKQAEAYTSGFAHVHEMNREHVKLEAEVLDVVGQQMTDGFSVVLAGVMKAGNNDLVPLVVEGRRLSLLARLDVNKRRRDMTRWRPDRPNSNSMS
jgi:CHASE3 domain sensor protein